MIKIEIITSSNKDQIGQFALYKNNITLGNHRHDIDLGLKDSFSINLENGKLKFINDKKPYLLNRKKALSNRNLRTEDSIILGETELKVIDYKEEENLTSKQVFDSKFEEILQEAGDRLQVLKNFQKRMQDD